LPPDSSTVQMVNLILPSYVSNSTPLIIMKIFGPGAGAGAGAGTKGIEKGSELVFVSKEGNAKWHKWEPVSHTIPAHACPWTISLFDWTGVTPLKMGKDGHVIKSALLSFNGKDTKFTFDDHQHFEAKPGDSIRIQNAGLETVDVHVQSVVDNCIAVTGNYTKYEGGIVCNVHAQAHIILESTLQYSAPKK
jgi:hypothetical protein